MDDKGHRTTNNLNPAGRRHITENEAEKELPNPHADNNVEDEDLQDIPRTMDTLPVLPEPSPVDTSFSDESILNAASAGEGATRFVVTERRCFSLIILSVDCSVVRPQTSTSAHHG